MNKTLSRFVLRQVYTRRFFSANINIPNFTDFANFSHADEAHLFELSSDKSIRSRFAQKLKQLNQIDRNINDFENSLNLELDREMQELFKAEISLLKENISAINNELFDLCAESQNHEISEVLVEVRAGIGGSEAALFATELSELYKLYFAMKDWKYSVVSESRESAHTREIIISLKGNCYFGIKSESGLHRVQRVPETESQGRIHTSTVSVAVIPQQESGRYILNEKDIRTDVYRSSGPGGQNVNKTNSAVRLVHIPTGITVCMQDERSQVENRVRGLKVLQMRVESKFRNEEQKKLKDIRTEQIGAGERSDKIRTYNFPQGRVTDHRLGLTNHNLKCFFENPTHLDELIRSYQNFCVNDFINSRINKL